MRRDSLERPEGFRGLSSILRPAMLRPAFDADAAPMPPIAEPAAPHEAESVELLREVRLFRARVAEAVDLAIATLLQDIAADVVGRELELAPVAIERIVDRALARYLAEEPLRIRVHPDDAAALREAPIAVEADPRLRRGDAAVDLRNGTVDASLGVRLDEAVRALAGA